MAHGVEKQSAFLLVKAASRLCALALGTVVETMRPLAFEPLAGAPAFILGVSLVRSVPAPVVDLAAAMDGASSRPPARFVALRDDHRRLLMLAVESVLGVYPLDPASLDAVPPLIGGLAQAAIEAFSRWDGGLLTILRSARLIPDEIWRQVAAQSDR